jgi:hypothetical protein
MAVPISREHATGVELRTQHGWLAFCVLENVVQQPIVTAAYAQPSVNGPLGRATTPATGKVEAARPPAAAGQRPYQRGKWSPRTSLAHHPSWRPPPAGASRGRAPRPCLRLPVATALDGSSRSVAVHDDVWVGRRRPSGLRAAGPLPRRPRPGAAGNPERARDALAGARPGTVARHRQRRPRVHCTRDRCSPCPPRRAGSVGGGQPQPAPRARRTSIRMSPSNGTRPSALLRITSTSTSQAAARRLVGR